MVSTDIIPKVDSASNIFSAHISRIESGGSVVPQERSRDDPPSPPPQPPPSPAHWNRPMPELGSMMDLMYSLAPLDI
ncbi:hypothetical protein CC80DRAFT_542857 [Byssothecium circinans]|uniref:Uncharacterized protein n=1 Tax=Byssothecium circinans TaxID=147558 RepID=A0A6A5UBK3_9PLEO|nr:hypothetical protein CC80DRAFT_542857 [Byssothecium circinans]